MSTERLLQAADRLDTVSALVTVDPAMGLIATEPVRRLLRVIGSREHHGEDDNASCWDCWHPLWSGHEADCIVGAADELADAILGDADLLDDDCPPVGDVDPAQVAASLRDIAAATPACPSCDGTGHVEWPGVTVSFTEAYATTTTAAWTPCPSCDGTGKETTS